MSGTQHYEIMSLSNYNVATPSTEKQVEKVFEVFDLVKN